MDDYDSGSDSDNSFLIGGRHADEDDSDEESSESSDEDHEDTFDDIVQRIKENNPRTTASYGYGHDQSVQNMTDEGWEEIGRDITNNTHLEAVFLCGGALDDNKMSFFFRGLTRSIAVKKMSLYDNDFNAAGIRSMVPFLQNSNILRLLNVNDNNIQSEGFNVLFRALRDSPIETLSCNNCGIESIEIDNDYFPKHLKSLSLYVNNVNTDGCRGLAKLLQGANATLTTLRLENNEIDDEGVAILVDVLQNNTSLVTLDLKGNDGISNQGRIMLLKLVNDAASIKATLQSNHTLKSIFVEDINDEIQKHTNMATRINEHFYTPESAGREKVIASHLDSQKRALICRLQGVDHSLYSEINPLHLPEVLSLIGGRHGQGELYVAVSLSIMTLFSTVNRKKCIKQQREYHAAIAAEHIAKVEELDAELAAIEAAEGNEGNEESVHHSNKRRRK